MPNLFETFNVLDIVPDLAKEIQSTSFAAYVSIAMLRKLLNPVASQEWPVLCDTNRLVKHFQVGHPGHEGPQKRNQ